MKKIEVIIPNKVVKKIIDELHKVFIKEVKENKRSDGYPGVTIIEEVKGRGKGHYHTITWSGVSFKVDLFAKSKIEIVVIDEDVERTINTIIDVVKNENLETKHMGKIFIYDVVDVVRIRDGKRGIEAIK
jgi:nitrogen regulatory protein P-II 1